MKDKASQGMDFFGRYLTIWVALCIVVGIGIGKFLPIIPETLSITMFGEKQVGDQVNIELENQTVAIVDTVERVMAERS